MDKSYQLIIIGGGPAGLTAGMYAARSRLRTLLLEKAGPGGQITNAELVDNFPGFPDGISGMDLGELMHKQATKYGLETKLAEVTGIELGNGHHRVKTTEGDFEARALIVAGGSEFAKLGVPGEAEFTGKGVSYCATCDGAFFRDQVVAVIGGGNAAITEAIFLTRFASKVIVVHRRAELRATKVIQEKAFADPKIEFVWDSVVEAVEGDSMVKKLRLRDLKTKQQNTLEVSGVFVLVGMRPNTAFLDDTVALDESGHIIIDQNMATSVPGIFAAGDIRHDSIKQTIAAAGDGAVAAVSAERYLSEG